MEFDTSSATSKTLKFTGDIIPTSDNTFSLGSGNMRLAKYMVQPVPYILEIVIL